MAGNRESGGGRHGSLRKMAVWAAATAIILLVPSVAMQVTDEVNWTGFDFAFAGVLMFGVGVAYELAARKTGNSAYRAGVGVALAAAFLLVWMNGAVGIVGSEDNPANLMYGGVLAVGIIGAVIAHFRADGMARAMIVTAFAQALVAVIALITGSGSTGSAWSLDVLGLTGFFTALWLIAAWLFRKAAQERPPAGAVP